MHNGFHEHMHGREHMHGQMPTLEQIRRHKLQMLVVIADRAKNQRVNELLQRWHVHFHFVCMAHGTASSEVLDVLGLGSVDKAVTISLAPHSVMPSILEALGEELKLARAGKGIAFTLPLSGVSSPVQRVFDEGFREQVHNMLEKEVEKMSISASHDLILAVINQGCSEDVMDAARSAGATGGTVIHARRISSEESVKFFGIAIQAEKEVVAIITGRDQKKAIMQAIGRTCGMRSEANGIVISIPVDEIIGLAELSCPVPQPGEEPPLKS